MVRMNDTQFPKLERQRVLESKLPSANPPVHVVNGVRIRFAPRQPTGRHRHPMSTCGVITCGSFDFQLQGEECKRLKPVMFFSSPLGTRFYNSITHRKASRLKLSVSISQIQQTGLRLRCWRGGMDSQLGSAGFNYLFETTRP